ncbi:cilia- and flagella-associated protein 45 [Pangasianodon hypophthalmus]|uniref:cilia- and flagella-associated protein 45 n=1 Tax=Pangasianodon hypophthalmus TaxID=310915 RepID=UPI0023080A72|nr:cilia- and flagella-associated protein 45 [Pangasianodon hypophthalmus]
MPQSGTSSSTRLSSNSAHTRRYRTRALTSQVDETLFGPVKQAACEVKNLANGDSRTQSRSAPATKAQNSETIRVITKDLIRDIRIPSKDPSGQSVILCPAEIKRIMGKSRVLTKEEKEAALETQRQAREEAMNAAEERKVLMQQADVSRQKNQALSDLETEARERAQYLLERANALRMEQEDEIKKLNELIQGAQCHAVRDVQIQEKKQILSELQEEERRLDAMMELDRRRALEVQEQIDELRKNQRIQGKMCILKQIEERQEEHMLQEELKEQEGQQMLENLEKLQMEELEAMEKRKAEQRRLQLEIMKINEESLLAKERRKEEERLADLRALEYARKKLVREAEYEAEQRRIKKEKEKEVARLRALQERERDHKAEQDALRARRNQEAAEREWRRKEKEQTKKKLEEDERLKAARLEQITHKERMLSIEAGRERAEFERVLRVQQELITREKEKEEKHQQHVLRHAEGVRQQVREREAQTITRRRELFREGEKLDEEARMRRARLDEIKDKKLKELKAAGLPEKYCNDVERKIHILPTLVR